MVDASDTLQLADIYAAIPYYLRHRDEVREYLKRRKEEAKALQTKIESEPPPITREERLERQKRPKEVIRDQVLVYLPFKGSWSN